MNKKRRRLPYKPYLKKYARKLRNNSTKSEVLLWLKLKGKQMKGYDFHRQKPLDNFIADFFCFRLMLVIEIDGASHLLEETQQKDKIKEQALNKLGLTILRFTDKEVYNEMNYVLQTIENYIENFEESLESE